MTLRRPITGLTAAELHAISIAAYELGYIAEHDTHTDEFRNLLRAHATTLRNLHERAS